MLDRAATEGNPVETVTLLTQALNQATITRQQLQSQANQAQAEMASWHRVAQAALKRNREDLARAALARKVNYRRKWEQIQKQLQDVDALQTSLLQNTRKLQQQIAIDPHHLQTTIS
jgi:phage shock protein A